MVAGSSNTRMQVPPFGHAGERDGCPGSGNAGEVAGEIRRVVINPSDGGLVQQKFTARIRHRAGDDVGGLGG